MENSLDELYLNNYKRHSYQWELWWECNNRCKFCYLGEENKETFEERQLASIRKLKEELKNLDYSYYNNISLIGGEFFQGQLKDKQVHDEFMDLMEDIAILYE